MVRSVCFNKLPALNTYTRAARPQASGAAKKHVRNRCNLSMASCRSTSQILSSVFVSAACTKTLISNINKISAACEAYESTSIVDAPEQSFGHHEPAAAPTKDC
jgi:hypothetical protein